MKDESVVKTLQDRLRGIYADPDFGVLEKRYQPYLELHGIGGLSGAFEIKPAPDGAPVMGKLIWHPAYDLPIDLKRELLRLFHKHFKA